MIDLILGFVLFLFSPTGLMVIMAGIVAYLVSPLLYRLTGVGKTLAHFPLWLTTTMMGRAAIVVSEHDDLLLKKMRFDDNGVERIAFGNITKEFEDPDNALHSWKGMTFALADEVHGVLFDPRHAAAGQRKREADARGEGIVPATTDEWETEHITEWVRGVFSFPRGHELVNLSSVRYLVGGGERAENPEQVQDIYKHSRSPLQGSGGISRYFLPIGAFLAVFVAIFAVSTQVGGGGGGSGGSTVSRSLLLLLGGGGLLGGRKHTWKIAKMATLWLVLFAVIGAIYLVMGALVAVLIVLAFLVGFFLIPVFAIFSRVSATLADAVASLLLVQGFVAYDSPVFEWTSQRYRIREYRDLDDPDPIAWYPFAGTTVGFTYQPGPESWGPDHIPNDELKERPMEHIVTDGGSAETNIPADCVPLNLRQRGSRGAFGPKKGKINGDEYYLHSGIVLQRFADAATGGKSMRRLTESKKEYGEGDGLSDKLLLYLTAAMGAFGGLLGVGVFFVL